MLDKFPFPNNQTPPKKILLVEDDTSIRRFLEIILQKEKYSVQTAEDGLVALKLALENPFDIIVTDAVMPNLSGFDLFRMLKQYPQYEKIPFILLTGFENTSNNFELDAQLMKNENLKDNLLQTISRLFQQTA